MNGTRLGCRSDKDDEGHGLRFRKVTERNIQCLCCRMVVVVREVVEV